METSLDYEGQLLSPGWGPKTEDHLILTVPAHALGEYKVFSEGKF